MLRVIALEAKKERGYVRRVYHHSRNTSFQGLTFTHYVRTH